jgi:hypothetical protein
MNTINCPNCNKVFSYNCHLIRHLNAKRKCKQNLEKVNNIFTDDLKTLKTKYKKMLNQISINDASDINNNCGYCFKTYSSKSNLSMHIKKSCKIRCKMQDQLTTIENLINNYKINISFNKKVNNKTPSKSLHSKKITNNIINNVNINNLNNITNNNLNLTINPFGQEDLSHITLKDYKKYLSGFFPGFIEYIKKIHYADEMPSNHNIYISNLNSKYAYVYKDAKWNVEKKEALVDNIVSKKMLLLDSKCDELEKQGLITQKNISDHDAFERNYTNGGGESEKYLADDVALLLYNNRDKIERNKQDLIKI